MDNNKRIYFNMFQIKYIILVCKMLIMFITLIYILKDYVNNVY